MRSILLVLASASSLSAGWDVKNVTLFEYQESPATEAFYDARGVPRFISEAEATPLWNGVSVSLLTTQACALSSLDGPRQLWCRGGEARVEFDVVLDTPMTLQWELWRSPETAVSLSGATVSTQIWEPVSEMLALGPGTYHLFSRAWTLGHSGADMQIKLTTPVPEPSAFQLVFWFFVVAIAFGAIVQFLKWRDGRGR
jgi:hypothetical protein